MSGKIKIIEDEHGIRNMDQRVIINPYRITDISDSRFMVTTLHGIWVHEDKNINKALNLMKRLPRRPLTFAQIISVFNNHIEDPDLVISTLKSQLKLFQSANIKSKIKKILLVSDNLEMMSQASDAIASLCDIEVVLESKLPVIQEDCDIIVCFFDDYSPELIKNIYLSHKQRHCLYLISYIRGRYFMIDNIHDSRATCPCHFCRRLHYRNNHMNTSYIKNNLSIFKSIEELESLRNISHESLPTTSLDRGIINFHLVNFIKNTIRPSLSNQYHEDMQKMITVNLDTGEFISGVSAYHPACGCWNQASGE